MERDVEYGSGWRIWNRKGNMEKDGELREECGIWKRWAIGRGMGNIEGNREIWRGMGNMEGVGNMEGDKEIWRGVGNTESSEKYEKRIWRRKLERGNMEGGRGKMEGKCEVGWDINGIGGGGG